MTSTLAGDSGGAHCANARAPSPSTSLLVRQTARREAQPLIASAISMAPRERKPFESMYSTCSLLALLSTRAWARVVTSAGARLVLWRSSSRKDGVL